MKYNGEDIGTWCAYEHVDELFAPYGMLPAINKSSSKNTTDLLHVFYDSHTRRAVEDYWAEDFTLHERVKNENRSSGH
jgi:hypothetical protein